MTPTVEEAAAEASISRTTAYRYFRNQRDLLVAAHPQIDMQSLLPDDPPDDPSQRLDVVIDAHLRMTVENEAALRTAFVLSLGEDEEHELILRRGRVIGWVEDALQPLKGRLSAKDISRLARAIRASAGIESLIWLCDVGGMTREEAVKLMKWTAHALLNAAIRDADRKRRKGSNPRSWKD